MEARYSKNKTLGAYPHTSPKEHAFWCHMMLYYCKLVSRVPPIEIALTWPLIQWVKNGKITTYHNLLAKLFPCKLYIIFPYILSILSHTIPLSDSQFDLQKIATPLGFMLKNLISAIIPKIFPFFSIFSSWLRWILATTWGVPTRPPQVPSTEAFPRACGLRRHLRLWPRALSAEI